MTRPIRLPAAISARGVPPVPGALPAAQRRHVMPAHNRRPPARG